MKNISKSFFVAVRSTALTIFIVLNFIIYCSTQSFSQVTGNSDYFFDDVRLFQFKANQDTNSAQDSVIYKVLFRGILQADSMKLTLVSNELAAGFISVVFSPDKPKIEDYKRNGDVILVGLQSIPHLDSAFVEISLRDSNGWWPAVQLDCNKPIK